MQVAEEAANRTTRPSGPRASMQPAGLVSGVGGGCVDVGSTSTAMRTSMATTPGTGNEED